MGVSGEVEASEIIDGLIAFIDAVVLPLEDQNQDLLQNPRNLYDARGAYSASAKALVREARTASAAAGYYGMFCPSEIGGGGLGSRAMLDAYESVYRKYGPGRLLIEATIAHWATGPSFLCRHFSPAVRETLLNDLMAGRVSMCFGMSEPNAGSDAWMMSTRAVKDGDSWVITGTKQWTSNSPYADYCYLFAVTDPAIHKERKGGVSCFLVPMIAPGVSVDSVIRMFGEIGGNEGIVSFVDVRVPAENLIGTEGQGFKLAMGGVSLGRVFNSGRALGLSRWALERAVDYAKTRETFGKPIAEYQGISFKLAESAMDIYAARGAAKDLTERLDRGERPIRELAMSKAICAEAFLRVADRCMQVCGAMGLTNELGMYKAWHSAKAMQLADGSAEILRETIAKRLLRGEVKF
jgi:acyl-CoA dehydrogenase